MFKQECIPVGCVLPTSLAISTRECLPQGPEGCLPLDMGVSASGSGGVYHKPPFTTSSLHLSFTTPPFTTYTPFITPSVDRQTPVKILPCPFYHALRGQTNTCENTTLPQTSFAVIIWIQIMLRPL